LAVSQESSAGGLDLDDAAFGELAGERVHVPGLLKLVRCVKAEIGGAGAGVGDLRDAAHPGLELPADLVEKSFQGTVVRFLRHGAAGRVDFSYLCQVGFQRMHLESSFEL